MKKRKRGKGGSSGNYAEKATDRQEKITTLKNGSSRGKRSPAKRLQNQARIRSPPLRVKSAKEGDWCEKVAGNIEGRSLKNETREGRFIRDVEVFAGRRSSGK